MKSIFVKILLLFSGMLVLCLLGLEGTNWVRNRFTPNRHDFFSRSLSLQVDEASHAYQTGGPEELRLYFKRLETLFPGVHMLVDRRGIDLVTGVDHSAMLKSVGPHWSPGTERRMALAWPSKDGNYRLVIDALPPPGPWSQIPYYLWIGLAVVIACYIVAVRLASPLRALEQAVHRFGGGDLSVRADAARKDEFGELARAFNLMADRIETLLTAERRLLQDVSHELRSPLARLEFAVELARSSSDRDRGLNRIQKEVGRLEALVSELLQVTRAESDPASRNFSGIPLRRLLQDVIDDVTVESEARNVLLRLEAEALDFRGDRELLRRAIENVLRNAIRYAPEGSAVEVGLRTAAGKAIIGIRDYGPGVPEESLGNLCKPFFRAEEDRNRNAGGGVGLGLSIAERAIALHQGGIRASNAHPGLFVEIELPHPAPTGAILTPVNG